MAGLPTPTQLRVSEAGDTEMFSKRVTNIRSLLIWRRLTRTAFILAAAVSPLLVPSAASALVIQSYAGQDYELHIVSGVLGDGTRGSVSGEVSGINLTASPWWGDSQIAQHFASVGYWSPGNGGVRGPIFLFGMINYAIFDNITGVRLNYLGGLATTSTNQAQSYVFAYATLFTPPTTTPPVTPPTTPPVTPPTTPPVATDGSGGTASVPGPLPILGLAAAFGFSRKLRKRIKLQRGTSAVSTPTGA